MLNLNLNIVGAANKPIVPIGSSPDIIPTTTTTTTSTTSTTTTSTTTTTTSTTTTTTTAAPTTVEFYIVAGGGGGGKSNAGAGGGGGAGGLLSGSLSVTSGSYTVSIGGGGAAAVDYDKGSTGTDSYIQRGAELYTALGGGYGGGGSSPSYDGGPGGSGGGGATNDNDNGMGGVGTAGQGYRGGDGGVGFRQIGGGGGGAFERAFVNTGGEGVTLPNGVKVAVGGNGLGESPSRVIPASTGNGGDAGQDAANLSPTSANPTAGASGTVLIRYSGTPVGTGGTITQSGGFTYHSFNSTGTFGWPV